MSALLTQSPGDTVQTETGKVDPARKFKCTTAARVMYWSFQCHNPKENRHNFPNLIHIDIY